MRKPGKAILLKAIDRLIDDGETLERIERAELDTCSSGFLTGFHALIAGYDHILSMLGRHAEMFRRYSEDRDRYMFQSAIGGLRALRNAVEDDLLIQVESLAIAEAFDDLLEQADHFFANGYLLAAGVLGRAVLEEHLRKLCDAKKCTPQKPRLTLSDFYDALDKANEITKIERKQIESLAAIGNHAAHNKPGFKSEDVERLLRDVRGFLALHPLD